MGNAIYVKKPSGFERVRNIKHKDTAWLSDRCVKSYQYTSYQHWAGFANSPFLTSDLPYQCIMWIGENSYRLLANDRPFCIPYELRSWNPDADAWDSFYMYSPISGEWQYLSQPTYVGHLIGSSHYEVIEANYAVFTDSTNTIVSFAATTEPNFYWVRCNI